MKQVTIYFEKDEIRDRVGDESKDKIIFVPKQAFRFDPRADMWALDLELYEKDEELQLSPL